MSVHREAIQPFGFNTLTLINFRESSKNKTNGLSGINHTTEIAYSFFYLTVYIGGDCLETLGRSTGLKKKKMHPVV